MAIQHLVIVVPNSPVARASVYGSLEEFQNFGNVLSAAVPLGMAGGHWGKPTASGNVPPLYAWGVWSTTINPTPLTFTKLQALATVGTVQLFTWDPVAVPETYDAYLTRWKTAVGWVEPPSLGP